MRWAVIDVDGTLFPYASMEKKFVLYLMKNGELPVTNIFHYLLIGIIRTLQRNCRDGFRDNKYYLKRLPARDIRVEAAKFVYREIWPNMSPKGIRRIRDCRKRGFKILIMSGSIDLLVQPLANFIQLDYFISSQLEIEDSLFTGHLKTLHPHGQRKVQILQGLQTKLDIDFQNSIVFANHHSDVPHMLLFGEAVAVNPTGRLLKFADKNHWDIERW